MAITNAVVNSRTQIPAIGGGDMVLARVTCNIVEEVDAHSVTPWLTALGYTASSASVIAIYDGGAVIDLEVKGGGDGIQPYIDYSLQNLSWRNSKTGAKGAENTALAAGNTASFNIVVRA
jgi:hypothetical protein